MRGMLMARRVRLANNAPSDLTLSIGMRELS
jgi:hypothetical protein